MPTGPTLTLGAPSYQSPSLQGDLPVRGVGIGWYANHANARMQLGFGKRSFHQRTGHW